MKKYILALTAVLLLANPFSVAQAITSGTALSWGTSVARSDCGRANDWICWSFPESQFVSRCATNRWCVNVGYYEAFALFIGSIRFCVTETHYAISSGALTFRQKRCP